LDKAAASEGDFGGSRRDGAHAARVATRQAAGASGRDRSCEKVVRGLFDVIEEAPPIELPEHSPEQ